MKTLTALVLGITLAGAAALPCAQEVRRRGISGYEQGYGADVVVFLSNDSGEAANLVVRYNGDKRFTGFAEAQIAR